MPVSLTTAVDNTADVEKATRILTKYAVLVGIPESVGPATERDTTGETYQVSNAQLGYIHEYGAPEKNIPARPFLIPGVQSITDKTNQRFENAGKLALAGDSSGVERTYNVIGLAAQKAVVQTIDAQNFVPLQPATLAARRAKGRTGTQILVDTGAMRAAITYVIRDNDNADD